MSDTLLQIDNLEMRFGGIVALHGVSFSACRGHITSIIGPNGAGKTTLFNCITGMYRPSGGRVTFDGRDLTRLSPFRIAHSGIARTFQNLALFERLTVFDNLRMGAYQHGRSGLLEGALLSPRARREEGAADERARETLAFLGIAEIAENRPAELSYGMLKQVEFARALMQGAHLILLDEPMAGMNQGEKRRFVELIRHVRDQRAVSFLLVEHDMPVVMGVSDHVVVLDFGRKIAEGEPRQVQQDSAVIAAYLGTEPAGEAA